MRISDWSSDVCSSDLTTVPGDPRMIKIMHWFMGDMMVQRRRGSMEMPANYPGAAISSSDPFCAEPSCARSILREIHPEHRSEEHTSELQSLMRISYAVFCLKKNNKNMKQQESIDCTELV